MTNGDDQQTCCIIGACCGNGTDVTELAEWLETHVESLNQHEAQATARALLGPHGFDLAPKGSIAPLIKRVAEMVRAHPDYNES